MHPLLTTTRKIRAHLPVGAGMGWHARSRRSVGSDANTADTSNWPDGLQPTRSPTGGSSGPTGRPGSTATGNAWPAAPCTINAAYKPGNTARRARARCSASPTNTAPMSDGTNSAPVRGIRTPPALGWDTFWIPRSCSPTDSTPTCDTPDATERHATQTHILAYQFLPYQSARSCRNSQRKPQPWNPNHKSRTTHTPNELVVHNKKPDHVVGLKALNSLSGSRDARSACRSGSRTS